MPPSARLWTVEPGQSRPRLNDRLRFTPHQSAGRCTYHVEDAARSRFHRIGYPEYLFLSLLDGRTTISQAVTLAARELGSRAFSQEEAVNLCGWALENGILLPESGFDSAAAATTRSLSLNPFWTKIPLFSPERLLTVLQPLMGWIQSPAALAAGLALLLAAAATLAAEWPRFVAESRQIWDAGNWWRLAVVWMGLKGVHELSHALACRRYGGRVPETGLIFVLFAPMAYVDVTSSWRFRSKWRRIHVAAAGMWIEILTAAGALLVWGASPGDSSRWLLDVVAMAGASTLLFNANPLMKFDGYYILSDLLEIPNLYPSGAAFVNSCWRRLFLGHPFPTSQESGWRGAVIRIYGVASAVWRLLVGISLAMAAAALLHGFGVLLTAAAFAMWFGRPLLRGITALRSQWELDPAPVARGGAIASTLLVLVILIGFVFPSPAPLTAPGIVAYADLAVVRAAAPGRVAKVLVRAGEPVSEGDLLLEIDNEDLRLERNDLKLTIEQSEVRRQRFLVERNVAAAQIESRNVESLHDRLLEIERQIDGLQVKAPRSGRVIAKRLEELRGVWVDEGEELLAVGAEDHKEVQLAVAQRDVERFGDGDGDTGRIEVRIPGRGVVSGTLTQITPRASATPPHRSLMAAFGGPLAAIRDESPEKNEEGIQLATPHFTATVALSADDSRPLKSGERADARLDAPRPPIAIALYRSLDRWLRERVRDAFAGEQ
jgi:putative peptide zinc metalloprotease protein